VDAPKPSDRGLIGSVTTVSQLEESKEIHYQDVTIKKRKKRREEAGSEPVDVLGPSSTGDEQKS